MNNQGMKSTTDQFHNQALSRSNCYGLLALLFRDTPTPETITQLRTPSMADVLNDLGYDVTQHLAGELGAVTACFREQYTQTFVGPGPHISLYASIYCDNEGQLWGDSTVWVKRFIERIGLSFRDNWDSIPDHIAIELELVQRLSAYEAQLWTQDASHDKENVAKQLYQCLHVQERFLQDHLCKWIPQFCEHVLETSTSLFYREMTQLTKSIVLSDAEQVKAAQTALDACHLSGVISNPAVRCGKIGINQA